MTDRSPRQNDLFGHLSMPKGWGRGRRNAERPKSGGGRDRRSHETPFGGAYSDGRGESWSGKAVEKRREKALSGDVKNRSVFLFPLLSLLFVCYCLYFSLNSVWQFLPRRNKQNSGETKETKRQKKGKKEKKRKYWWMKKTQLNFWAPFLCGCIDGVNVKE